jgi:uncharacterized protein
METDDGMEEEPVRRPGLGRLTELLPGDLRVLGVLLEKEQTTPEYYPMSLKAIVAGCNQKNNREPVMSMPEQEALNVLRVLTQEGLAKMEYGARVDRWRHNMDTLLKFRSAPKALLTELLLRGPQTPGELKARCERMHAFQSLAQVDEQLHELANGEDRVIYRLPRQPGQKEERWIIGLEGQTPLYEPEVVSRIPPAAPALEDRLAILEARVDELQAEVRELRQRLSESGGMDPGPCSQK